MVAIIAAVPIVLRLFGFFAFHAASALQKQKQAAEEKKNDMAFP
jgi:hypothetical protein